MAGLTSLYDQGSDDGTRQLDRFGALASVTVLSIVLLMYVDLDSPLGNPMITLAATAATTAAGAMVLLAFRASGMTRRWIRLADMMVMVAVAALLFLLLIELIPDVDFAPTQTTYTPVAYTALTAIAPIVVVRRLLQHDRATRSTLLGAVAAYLLIAICFNYAFLTADAIDSTPFFGDEQPTTSFMYFSLVTLTTLGYGDLSPATDTGRLLATTEAVVGQVFLVTFVAMIVGLLAQQRAQR